MATRAQAERFLTLLQHSVVTAGQSCGLPASEAVDLTLRYAIELHAQNCGIHATAARLTEAGEAGFNDLLSELGASFTSSRFDA